MKRPLLYMAGPYTRPEPVINTHAVCRAAMEVYEQTHWCPVVPHLSLLWHAVTPREEAHWYGYDLHLLRSCDALVRLPGESVGADKEVAFAKEHMIEIIPFDSLPQGAILAWLETR